nr:hypothetical protein [Tanacetum cinerariifolium]
MHSTFHVPSLMKCLSDETLVIPRNESQFDDKLHLVKEPIEIIDREVERLTQSRISINKPDPATCRRPSSPNTSPLPPSLHHHCHCHHPHLPVAPPSQPRPNHQPPPHYATLITTINLTTSITPVAATSPSSTPLHVTTATASKPQGCVSLFMTAPVTKQIKDKVKEHLIVTRRNLTLTKNGKVRVKAKGSYGLLLGITMGIGFGRAHYDVLLNSMCKMFNSKIVGGRHKPVITALEYIRDYCVERILNVQNVIDKSVGPLTPTASCILYMIKKEAVKYIILFNRTDKFHVSGPWGDYCVGHDKKMVCSCRRWETTGVPCKHVVTWKETYKHTIQPINGNEHWEKSTMYTTLLHPKHHIPIGSPRKKITNSTSEKEDIVKDGKLSRAWKRVTYGSCGNLGYNKTTFIGQYTFQSCQSSVATKSKNQNNDT